MTMTIEQKKLIADIAEQIVELGLLEEAITTKDPEAFE